MVCLITMMMLFFACFADSSLGGAFSILNFSAILFQPHHVISNVL